MTYSEQWQDVAEQFRSTAQFAIKQIERGKPGSARRALLDTLGVFRDVFPVDDSDEQNEAPDAVGQ